MDYISVLHPTEPELIRYLEVPKEGSICQLTYTWSICNKRGINARQPILDMLMSFSFELDLSHTSILYYYIYKRVCLMKEQCSINKSIYVKLYRPISVTVIKSYSCPIFNIKNARDNVYPPLRKCEKQ
jgi:hypothetical protein